MKTIMDNKYFKQLINAMTNDVRTYRELKKVLQDKFESIKSRDAARLEEINAIHDTLLRVIASNTTRRMQILDIIVKQLFPGRNSSERVSITEIANYADQHDRGKLMALKAMLYKEAESVQSLSRINNLAVKKMLGHLDYIFKTIVSFENDNGVYSKNGTQATAVSSGLIDAIA